MTSSPTLQQQNNETLNIIPPPSPPSDPIDMVSPQAKTLIESVILNACLTSLMFGYCITYFNSINFDQIREILDLKQIDRSLGQGLLTGCIPISACFGAVLSARFLQWFSRKGCFVVFNCVCIVSVLCIQTKLMYFIIFGRLLQGTFIGLGSSIVPLYIKEFIPEINGRYGIFHQIFITTGIVLSFGLNLILYPIFDQNPENYWRFIFCLPLIICGYQTYKLRFKFWFDTPRYLVSEGKYEEALQLLRVLYREEYVERQFQILKKATKKNQVNTFDEEKKFDIELMSRENNQHFGKNINEAHLQRQSELARALIQKQYDQSIKDSKLATFCAFHVSLLQQLVGIGLIIVYSGEIALDLFPSLQRAFPVIIHSIGVLSTFSGVFLVKKYGRVTLLQTGGLIIFFCQLLIGYNFIQKEQGNKPVIVVGMVVLRAAFSFSLGPIVWLYLPEIIRPAIMPYATMANWVGATLVMFFFPIVKEWLGNVGWVFLALGGYCGTSIIVNYFCLVQTKGMHELQIRQGFNRKQKLLKSYLSLKKEV